MAKLFDPPTVVVPQYFYLSDDQRSLMGQQSFTWANKQGVGGDLTAPTGSTANRAPFVTMSNCGDHPAVNYNGTYNAHTAVGSASVCKQFHVTANQCELFVLFRLLERNNTARIIGSGEGGSTNNWQLTCNTLVPAMSIRSTSGIVLGLNAPAIKRGGLYLYNYHHNLNAAKASINGGQTENSGTRANTVADANMVRDFCVGAVNTGSPVVACSDVFMVWIADTELSAGDRLAFYTEARRCYPNLA